jgi:hypothetical protein
MTTGKDHVAIVQFDERKRLTLGRYITKEPTQGWKLYRSPDGRELRLEAIVDE